MTDAVTKCIAPNCEREAALDSPLCRIHKDQLERVEEQIIRDAGKKIRRELRQFERLMYLEDNVSGDGVSVRPQPLTAEEIAHRMVWPLKDVKRMLKKFKDERA